MNRELPFRRMPRNSVDIYAYFLNPTSRQLARGAVVLAKPSEVLCRSKHQSPDLLLAAAGMEQLQHASDFQEKLSLNH